MVFSSIPVYDHQHPPNWHLHEQRILQQENTLNPQLQQVPLPTHANTTGSTRLSSMSDRARLARIPHPEAALKCPRCESTDTKFCYFNNRSLSQPRHYCKTCRRYWTRGGSLRNVPVGGGCRRNKKSKSSSSSKSKGGAATTTIDNSTDKRLKITRSSSTSTDLAPGDDHDNYTILGHYSYPQQPPQLPFLSSLQNLTHLGSIDPLILAGQNSIFSADQWSSVQQFPFLARGFDQSPDSGGEARLAPPVMTSGAFRVRDPVSAGAVKMEETLKYSRSSARPFLGNIADDYDNNEQYHSSWGGAWNNDYDDQTAAGQQLYSTVATAHFL